MAIFEGLFPGKPKRWNVDQVPDMSGKVVVVTGGAVGIGYETVKVLVEHGAEVVIVTRSKEKTDQAIEKLRSHNIANLDKLVHFMKVDLADFSTIQPFAEEFLAKYDRLDVLINNAGVMIPPSGSMSKDGYDLQFATNVLGHFALTQALLPLLLKTAETSPKPVRVVWLTSSGHHAAPKDRPIHWDELKATKQKLWNWSLYGQSKAGNILLAFHMQKLFGSKNIQTIAVHPGAIQSELNRHSGFFARRAVSCLLYPQPYGAINSMFAATSSEIKGGEYVIPWAVITPPRADMLKEDLQEETWKKTCQILKDNGVKVNYE